ncbi:ML domain-containing protein [Streptomyces sp. URMC 124]|uniref:ML domain-containing protein n=1 Tax=Streptomyces sp. URMC 124 TaxID=3423405 RepID=UPI003F19B67C
MAGWSYTDAGLASDPLQIESIRTTPDPPMPGTSLKATVKAAAQEEIVDGAYIEVVVKLGLVKLFTKRYDLFEKLRGDTSDWSLTADTAPGGEPIMPGNVELTFGMDLPRETPQAKFTVNARGYTVDDDDLFSLDFRVDFMKQP